MPLAVPAISIEDDADVARYRFAIYLSREPALIEAIQRSERPGQRTRPEPVDGPKPGEQLTSFGHSAGERLCRG